MHEDDLDKRTWARTQKSYGPNWDAAIEYGIDVSLIELSLSRSIEQRAIESLEMTRFALEARAVGKRLHGAED